MNDLANGRQCSCPAPALPAGPSIADLILAVGELREVAGAALRRAEAAERRADAAERRTDALARRLDGLTGSPGPDPNAGAVHPRDHKWAYGFADFYEACYVPDPAERELIRSIHDEFLQWAPREWDLSKWTVNKLSRYLTAIGHPTQIEGRWAWKRGLRLKKAAERAAERSAERPADRPSATSPAPPAGPTPTPPVHTGARP